MDNIAVVTYAYNESVNLPIWLRYYGTKFGYENLFIFDHGSTDDSMTMAKEFGCNIIRLPRDKFDDADKAFTLSTMHSILLRSYRIVICTDCDEIIVPDPKKYSSLHDYLQQNKHDYVTGLGLNIIHAIDREPPLNLEHRILHQRYYAMFSSTECKTLISKVPLTWCSGLHATNLVPNYDPDLFIFHTKLMDYSIAYDRQEINNETVWSKSSLEKNHGNHHRFDLTKFIQTTFIDFTISLKENKIDEFGFDDIIEKLQKSVKLTDDFYTIPSNVWRNVKIPVRFSGMF